MINGIQTTTLYITFVKCLVHFNIEENLNICLSLKQRDGPNADFAINKQNISCCKAHFVGFISEIRLMESNYTYDEVVGLQKFNISKLKRNQWQTETIVFNGVRIRQLLTVHVMNLPPVTDCTYNAHISLVSNLNVFYFIYKCNFISCLIRSFYSLSCQFSIFNSHHWLNYILF